MIKNTYLNFEKTFQSACIYKRNTLEWGVSFCVPGMGDSL